MRSSTHPITNCPKEWFFLSALAKATASKTHDPSKIIARTHEPLIAPNEVEREGYVPNVVYTCGAILHQNHLVIPYAMSDYATTFATIGVEELLSSMF